MSANESELPDARMSVDARIANAHKQLRLAAESAENDFTRAALLEVCDDLENLSERDFVRASELPVLDELEVAQ